MKVIKLKTVVFLSISLVFLAACKHSAPSFLKNEEGFIPVNGGKVWYQVIGSGPKTPIILLHGGPGIPHYYLKPLAALSADRPIIFFDQLGCGKSDRITDTSLLTIENYVKQLAQVVKHFNLKEYYLYGNSWGSMLGVEYYLNHPDGVKGLILSGPALSTARWIQDADTLLATLPVETQQVIRTNEANNTTDAPTYQEAVMAYYDLYLTRKKPMSADMDSTFAQIGMNVYQHMWGPSEFTATGNLKNYDRTEALKQIRVPTLFISGEFDEARPATVQYYTDQIPGARHALIQGSAHLTMQDAPEQELKAITNFLTDIEK
jgi:proline iminopeptidase